jgi:PAT family beta-lactamase induction signal transducer AmpG
MGTGAGARVECGVRRQGSEPAPSPSCRLPLAPAAALRLNRAVPRTDISRAAAPAPTLNAPPARRSPWAWIPTLYFAQGLPNALVASVSLVVYLNLGLSNAEAAFYTSWLYLPWVVKPLWSPVVDVLRTRRGWIWSMQFCVATGLAGVALTIPTRFFLQLTLAFFWLMALESATHDIAADGFYILANSEREQAFFSGVRNTCFNLARIAAQGALVALAGKIKDRTASFAFAWSVAFGLVAGTYFCLALYHWLVLPHPAGDLPGPRGRGAVALADFYRAFASFFKKPGLQTALSFLLLYRFGEAQLLKMVQPFLLAAREHGGLGLSNAEFGLVYGTGGVMALVGGGLLGGVVVSRRGLRFWLWPMAFAMHLPDAVFVYLSHAQPRSLALVGACVAVEQFGYGFGFAAYMLYMLYLARGSHQTAHYAICTGFMALGLMVPGMWSGWLQQVLGYPAFFAWVLLATIPGFLVTALIKVEADFGRRG